MLWLVAIDEWTGSLFNPVAKLFKPRLCDSQRLYTQMLFNLLLYRFLLFCFALLDKVFNAMLRQDVGTYPTAI